MERKGGDPGRTQIGILNVHMVRLLVVKEFVGFEHTAEEPTGGMVFKRLVQQEPRRLIAFHRGRYEVVRHWTCA